MPRFAAAEMTKPLYVYYTMNMQVNIVGNVEY